MNKTIKVALLFLLALACGVESHAQARKVLYLQSYDKAPYHFGFLLGANFMDYNLMLKEDYNDPGTKYYDHTELNTNNIPYSANAFESYQIIKVERDSKLLKHIPRLGFSVGVIGDLRLSDYSNLRLSPTFSLSEINYQYTLVINYNNGSCDTICTDDTRSHNQFLSCVEFPIHLKYRSRRYNNVAAYLIAGANPKLYFSFKRSGSSINWLNPKAFDLALELGTGFDIYNQWFKMGVEFKFAFGLFDAMSDSQVFFYGNPLNGFKNKQFQLSFTFE